MHHVSTNHRPPCRPMRRAGGCRLEEASPHGEDQFEVAAALRVDMKAHNVDAPYQQHKGDFHFRFSLVFASLEDVLPQVGCPVLRGWVRGRGQGGAAGQIGAALHAAPAAVCGSVFVACVCSCLCLVTAGSQPQ